MICEPCVEGDHPKCEDQVRQDKFVEWMRATYGGIDNKPVVGQEEMRVIKANRPYPSCSCQHKRSNIVTTCGCRIRETGLQCVRKSAHPGMCTDQNGWKDKPAFGHDTEHLEDHQ